MEDLKDIQNLEDERGIDIQKVGVKDVEMPLSIQRKNDSDQIVCAKARMSVSLPRQYKGTHMSRFIKVLNSWGERNLLSTDLRGCLDTILHKLDAKSAEVCLKFKYFINKTAPVSGQTHPMGYDCSFHGEIKDQVYKFTLGVKVPVTTLCPCSKEISNFGAHNQRALISVKISYPENDIVWIEDLVSLIEQCGSCPVYPFLKRPDEKFVTEHAYQNPKFVEDVIRDVIVKLRSIPVINEFEVECEAFESIHNHNAWAYQKEILKK